MVNAHGNQRVKDKLPYNLQQLASIAIQRAKLPAFTIFYQPLTLMN